MARPLRIALFVDGGDWHAKRLLMAFAAQGAEARRLSLKDAAIDTSVPHGLDLPGFRAGLPDGAFVKTVDAGTFQQVTFRLGVLHALKACGVRVWNDAAAIERCVDKSATSFRLARAGLPTPPTRVTERLAEAQAHAAGQRPLVAKPLFGSRGQGLRRVDGPEDLPPAEGVAGVWYLQDYVAPSAGRGFSDWRVLVSAARVVATMRRRGASWITNLHQGAIPESARDPEIESLALAAAEAVGADYAGVDLIRDAHGRPFVLEVNSMPSWNGLQSVSETDIAARLVDDFLAAVRARQ